MSKLKDTHGITDLFREILNLSDSQINVINNLEYDTYKAHFWSNRSEQALKFGFLRSLFSLLDIKQITALKSYKNDIIYQKKLNKDKDLKNLIERESNRLKDLNLTEEQLFKYSLAKMNLPKLAKEKMMERAKNGINKISYSSDRNELEKELILPIFTHEQITIYSKIVKKEKLLELEWHYKFTKDRFENDYDVRIADHIVPLIYEIEDQDNVYDDYDNIKSEFEQEEEKMEKYRKILNPDQFHNYLKKYNQRITQIKQNLNEINQNHFKQLESSKATFNYYVKNVLPEKVKARKLLEKELTPNEKSIIDKLRILYLQKLEVNKANALKQHQKYHQDHVPNEWKDYLIHHNFNILKPNGYLLSKNELALDLLSEEIIKKIKTFQSNLTAINKEFKEFQINLYESTGGNYGGNIIKIQPSLEQTKLEYLSFLLLEPNLESILSKLSSFNTIT
ncbi:MAG: hypothetical protein IPK35_11060 [Saprospiraceae bacterium]|nr:hypothetical protein [Saprospiraceae bacterium]